MVVRRCAMALYWPMPFTPADNLARVAIGFRMPDGEATENVFHVHSNIGWSAPGLTNVANAVVTWLTTAVGGSQPIQSIGSDTTVEYVTATDVSIEPGATVTITGPTLPLAGEAGSVGGPNLATKAVRLSSGLTGRNSRGRLYWVGVPAMAFLDTDNNQMTATFLSKLVAFLGSLIVTINEVSSNLAFVVMNRQTGGVPLNPYQWTPLNSSAVVNPYFDTQRRRGPGRLAAHA